MCLLRILSLQVESENADLKLQVVLVTKERDSVIQTNQGLQTKLENLEQVLKVSRIHMAGRAVQTPTAAFGWHLLSLCLFSPFFCLCAGNSTGNSASAGSWNMAFPSGQRCIGKAASGICVGDKVAIIDLRVFCDSVALPCDGNFLLCAMMT